MGRTGRAFRRVREGFGLIIQGTGAATLAWFVARQVVGNHEPFFAPIAAVAALNASVGRRGTNALRLLTGVFPAGVALIPEPAVKNSRRER